MRTRRTVLIAAMLAMAAVAAAPARSVRAAGPSPTSVSIGRTEVGPPIPPGFIGFSFEFQAVRAYTGPNPRAINPVLVQLIRNLAPGQTPVLRIGGNSTDGSWWPTRGATPSPGVTYTLTRSWLATTRTLAAETGARLILGLNLKLDSAAEIAAEARAFRDGIGRRLIDAFEIGNEPELYPIVPYYYQGPNQVPVYPRPRSYDFHAYTAEIARFARTVGGAPLAGPATGQSAWLAHLPRLFAAAPALKVVTFHRYPLIRCFTKPGDPGYPSIPNLLSLRASRGLLGRVSHVIAVAHRHRAVVRVDELNSVACQGQPGVSDTFASALWMLDTLFAMARSGVDGVNIHTLPQAAYEPFSFSRAGGRWLGSVQPEYYALLLFAQAAPPGSRLLSVRPPANPDLRVRAVLTPAGAIHVVLINDSLTSPHVVLVRAPVRASTALLERLKAPGGAAATVTAGVTLGGQSFGAETATARLAGAPHGIRLSPVHGTYAVTLPPASAAMLSFPPAGAAVLRRAPAPAG